MTQIEVRLFAYHSCVENTVVTVLQILEHYLLEAMTNAPKYFPTTTLLVTVYIHLLTFYMFYLMLYKY